MRVNCEAFGASELGEGVIVSPVCVVMLYVCAAVLEPQCDQHELLS